MSPGHSTKQVPVLIFYCDMWLLPYFLMSTMLQKGHLYLTVARILVSFLISLWGGCLTYSGLLFQLSNFGSGTEQEAEIGSQNELDPTLHQQKAPRISHRPSSPNFLAAIFYSMVAGIIVRQVGRLQKAGRKG